MFGELITKVQEKMNFKFPRKVRGKSKKVNEKTIKEVMKQENMQEDKRESKLQDKASLGYRMKDMMDKCIFYIKGMDLEDHTERVVRISCILGVSLLVTALMGRTIYYVTVKSRENQKIRKETILLQTDHADNAGQTDVVQVEKEQSLLERQYSKVVEKVEELMKTNQELQENREAEKQNKLTESRKDSIAGMDGQNGANGEKGANGKDGEKGVDGKNGLDGSNGKDGLNGKDGVNGNDGKSVYELALESGYTGSEAELSSTIAGVGTRITDVEANLSQVLLELEETKKSVADGKALIASAVTEKGVETSATSSFEELKEKVTDLYYKGIADGETASAGSLAGSMNGLFGSMNSKLDTGLSTDYSGSTSIDSMASGLDTAKNRFEEKYEQEMKNQYMKGYVDGQESATENLGIEYEYHYHTGDAKEGGGCYSKENFREEPVYGTCPNQRFDFMYAREDGTHHTFYTFRCGVCGREDGGYGPSFGDKVHTSAKPTSYKKISTGFSTTCNYNDGQLLKATITY